MFGDPNILFFKEFEKILGAPDVPIFFVYEESDES